MKYEVECQNKPSAAQDAVRLMLASIRADGRIIVGSMQITPSDKKGYQKISFDTVKTKGRKVCST